MSNERQRAAVNTRTEYGVIVDRTSDGLGYYLAKVTESLPTAEMWAELQPEVYPVEIKRRTVTYTDWQPMGADGSRRMSELSESEREAISAAWNGSIRNGAEPTIAVVEAILAARLAPIRQILAAWEAWDGSPGPDGRTHPDASSPRDRDRLRAALTAPLSEVPAETLEGS